MLVALGTQQGVRSEPHLGPVHPDTFTNFSGPRFPSRKGVSECHQRRAARPEGSHPRSPPGPRGVARARAGAVGEKAAETRFGPGRAPWARPLHPELTEGESCSPRGDGAQAIDISVSLNCQYVFLALATVPAGAIAGSMHECDH